MQQGGGRVTDRLPDQAFGVLVSVPFRNGVVVREEFVYHLYLAIDDVEEGIDPAKGCQRLQEEQVQAVPLPDVVELVPEHLSAQRAVSFQVIVPEDPVKKGEGGAGFCGNEEADLSYFFHGAGSCQQLDITQLPEKEVEQHEGYQGIGNGGQHCPVCCGSSNAGGHGVRLVPPPILHGPFYPVVLVMPQQGGDVLSSPPEPASEGEVDKWEGQRQQRDTQEEEPVEEVEMSVGQEYPVVAVQQPRYQDDLEQVYGDS